MFKFWRDKQDGVETAHYEGAIPSDAADSIIIQRLAREVTNKLAEAWVEQYGDKLLDTIEPEAVVAAMKKRIIEGLIKI